MKRMKVFINHIDYYATYPGIRKKVPQNRKSTGIFLHCISHYKARMITLKLWEVFQLSSEWLKDVYI